MEMVWAWGKGRGERMVIISPWLGVGWGVGFRDLLVVVELREPARLEHEELAGVQ